MAAIAIGLHFKNDRTLARPAVFVGLPRLGANVQNVHAVHRDAGNAIARAPLIKLGVGRRPGDGSAHAVLVVFDDDDQRQRPQGGHVEGFVNLALVDRAVAQINRANAAVAGILVLEGQAGADRHLRADDSVAAEEVLLPAEHVHGPALASGITAGTAVSSAITPLASMPQAIM